MRSDLQALIDHAGSGSRLRPIPVLPAELALRALELAHLSPLAEWHYKTAHRDSFVTIERRERAARLGAAVLERAGAIRTYDWYLETSRERGAGMTHRVPWNQQALAVFKRLVMSGEAGTRSSTSGT